MAKSMAEVLCRRNGHSRRELSCFHCGLASPVRTTQLGHSRRTGIPGTASCAALTIAV
jgi:hypothetical protein